VRRNSSLGSTRAIIPQLRPQTSHLATPSPGGRTKSGCDARAHLPDSKSLSSRFCLSVSVAWSLVAGSGQLTLIRAEPQYTHSASTRPTWAQTLPWYDKPSIEFLTTPTTAAAEFRTRLSPAQARLTGKGAPHRHNQGHDCRHQRPRRDRASVIER
jgi:hypothetical protein